MKIQAQLPPGLTPQRPAPRPQTPPQAPASSTPIPAPAKPEIPDELKPAMEIIKRRFPRVEPKAFPKRPADSVWIFHSNTVLASAEVGFEGAEVVYMIFRRGLGGMSWERSEVRNLYGEYCFELLKDSPPERVRYRHMLAPQINAAVIIRTDLELKSITGGL